MGRRRWCGARGEMGYKATEEGSGGHYGSAFRLFSSDLVFTT